MCLLLSLHLDLSIWQSKWTHLPDPLCSCWKAFIVSAAFNCNGKCCYGAIKILHNSQKLKYIFHLLKRQVYWLNMQWLAVGENIEISFYPYWKCIFWGFWKKIYTNISVPSINLFEIRRKPNQIYFAPLNVTIINVHQTYLK